MRVGRKCPGAPRRRLPAHIFALEAIESRLLLSSSPLAAVPPLSSDTGAACTVYLDFHGEPSQRWGAMTIPATPAYDVDGDPTTDTRATRRIVSVWKKGVAAKRERYAEQ